MSHSVVVWLLRALGAIWCLFFAVPSFGLADQTLCTGGLCWCGRFGRGGTYCQEVSAPCSQLLGGCSLSGLSSYSCEANLFLP